MAESSLADSSSGPSVILMLVARSAGGSTCAAVGHEKSRLPAVTATTSIRSSRFMDRPLAESLNSNSLGKTTKGAWRPRATPMRLYLVRTRPLHLPFSVLHYRIGFGLGRGARPQIAGGQVGSGRGVGMRNSLPWVEAEPPDMQVPVKVSRLGKGLVKPSVSVCMNATIWSSSASVKPRLPTVLSILFGTSGLGQQFTFSVVPGGQCPEVTLNGYTSRVL